MSRRGNIGREIKNREQGINTELEIKFLIVLEGKARINSEIDWIICLLQMKIFVFFFSFFFLGKRNDTSLGSAFGFLVLIRGRSHLRILKAIPTEWDCVHSCVAVP